MGRCLSLSLFVLMALAGVAQAVEAKLGLTSAEYRTWINQLATRNLRPNVVSVHIPPGGVPLFSAVAVPIAAGVLWEARHDLSNADFHKALNELKEKEYRPICFCPYMDGKELLVACLWLKDNRRPGWFTTWSQAGDAYQKKFEEMAGKGQRPAVLFGYPTLRGTHFAGLFTRPAGGWTARHGMSGDDLVRTIDEQTKTGFRVAWASGYREGADPRFNLILEQDATKQTLLLHNLEQPDFQNALDRNGRDGWALEIVSGYSYGNGSRYLGVWSRDVALPVSGLVVPQLAAFDEAMLKFMRERGIRGGALAVMRNGRIVLSRGYGYATRDGTRRIDSDTPFRLGNASKPFTSALVHKLIADGKLTGDTRVFPYLDVKPPPGRTADARLGDITVRHLLAHRGGWDPAVEPVFDPMFQPVLVARELRKSSPASPRDIIRFMAGQPLQADPGSKYLYSNFGHCVLGRVIEKAAGKPYHRHLREALIDPLGLRAIFPGRTEVSRRHAREPEYIDPRVGPNLMTGKGLVSWADGGQFHLEALDSCAGLVGSAPDVARFLQAYWLDGRPRSGIGGNYFHFGVLPGSYCLLRQLPSEVNLVALFNQSTGPVGMPFDSIKDVLDKTVDGIANWP
jgi:N-acyl-D-amino-acid deacylase